METGLSETISKKIPFHGLGELLTEKYNLNKNDLYVTVFEGDKTDGLEVDSEAFNLWKNHIDEDRIILASKKDNFWEMGGSRTLWPPAQKYISTLGQKRRK